MAQMAAGPPGMVLHVYAVRDPLPRVSVECGPGCAGAATSRARPGEITIDAELPAPGTLVVRDNNARGWAASADGRAAEVTPRGRYMTIGLEAGRHAVVLRYHPPRLRLAQAVTALGIAACALALAGKAA
jgi:hypothetical protein